MLDVSFKPYIPENYDAICSASESNKQNLRDKTLGIYTLLLS